MKTLGEIWRRIAFAPKALGRIRARVKTRDALEVDVTLARAEEKSAWQSGEIERLRAEIVHVRTEYARVREENRALLNSILGIAGIPPITVALQDARTSEAPNTNSAAPPRSHPSAPTGPEAPASITAADKTHPLGTPVASGPASPSTDTGAIDMRDRAEYFHAQEMRVNAAAARGKNLHKVTAPMRRRSWQQINRTLEFDAARKQAGRDAESLDT